jgi:hypothetical protein
MFVGAVFVSMLLNNQPIPGGGGQAADCTPTAHVDSLVDSPVATTANQ